MRLCGSKPQFLEKKGKLLGICLPADYAAEHEWGIDKLKALFGIKKYSNTEGPDGLERRQATKAPSKEIGRWGTDRIFDQQNDLAALTIGFHIYGKPEERKPLLQSLPSDLHRKSRNTLPEFVEGAWDEGSFGIVAKGKKNIDKLCQLDQAIDAVNVAVFLGGGNIFENAGLIIAIADRFPHEHKAEMKKKDEDNKKLHLAAEATGIKKKVCETLGERSFYALTPFWNNRPSNSKYNVRFWLNPSDQQNNNYGSFTVEELEQWIEGKGPIPIKGNKNER